jgi:hypothetical protein
MNDTTLATEFLRRLKHQCELAISHARVCGKQGQAHCVTGAFIQRAIKSTAADLKALGWAREATDIIQATMDVFTRGSQAVD